MPNTQPDCLLTVDVWDTLLRRQCDGDAVKLFMTNWLVAYCAEHHIACSVTARAMYQKRLKVERAIGRINRVCGYSNEYRLADVWKAVIRWAVSASPEVRHALLGRCLTAELHRELAVSYPDAGGIQEMLTASPCRKLYLSDFYMSKGQIDVLLGSAGLLPLLHGGYSSCDHLQNKRDGTLFKLLRAAEPHADWTHIGDNVTSDKLQSSAHGASAILYQPVVQHAIREEISNRFQLRMTALSEYFIALATQEPGGSAAYALGKKYAPMFIGFAWHIAQEAKRVQANKVFFMTREGEFFKDVYDKCVTYLVPDAPPSELLEVSRMATFAGSLRQGSVAEMRRMWNFYRMQSPRVLIKSLGFPADTLRPHFEKAGIPWDETVENPWKDPRIVSLFGNPEFSRDFEAALDLKREELQAYLRFKGLVTEESVCFVDIGWRGSIQDNLAFALPHVKTHGVYIGLHPAVAAAPDTATKSAYLLDTRHKSTLKNEERLSFKAPFEMMCNSPLGSVTGYKVAGGSVVALRSEVKGETAVYDMFTRDFQKGVLDIADVTAKCFDLDAVDSLELKQQALKLWDSILYSPDACLVAALESLEHNEDFGIGSSVKFSYELSRSQVWRAFISKTARTQLRDAINALPWRTRYISDKSVPPEVRLLLKFEPVLRQVWSHFKKNFIR